MLVHCIKCEVRLKAIYQVSSNILYIAQPLNKYLLNTVPFVSKLPTMQKGLETKMTVKRNECTKNKLIKITKNT